VLVAGVATAPTPCARIFGQRARARSSIHSAILQVVLALLEVDRRAVEEEVRVRFDQAGQQRVLGSVASGRAAGGLRPNESRGVKDDVDIARGWSETPSMSRPMRRRTGRVVDSERFRRDRVGGGASGHGGGRKSR
jgi:hypothetical protein